ncbi:uncharacterized protein LOC133036898 [Cannabis sativa]|uniref:uncharacterized protein LOC133036898 n=1 Tax=Cannabis sativa TaxID=3483 RepID=UPI0029CA5603|nr:uncharacterized protein LOC133036898 [Cannabis sativa]
MAPGEHTPGNASAQTGSNVANQQFSTFGASSSNVSVPHFRSTLNQQFALKLDRNDFSLWKTMVMAIVRGHRLDGYLTGGRSRPAEYISAPSVEGEPGTTSEMNSEFEQWIVNDQLLMGWLYGSMTESIATEVMGCSSSADLWSGLESSFGDPYPESLLVSNVLSGLDMEYLPIVLQIEAREKTTWQTLQDLLLSFDSKLDRLGSFSGNSKHGNNGSPSANLDNKGSAGGGNYNPGNSRGRGGNNNNSSNRGRSNGRGRGGRGGPKS